MVSVTGKGEDRHFKEEVPKKKKEKRFAGIQLSGHDI